MHALLQLTAFMFFAVVLTFKLQEYPDIQVPATGILILEAAGFLIMTAGNFIGGDLVYKDGVGLS